MLDTTRTARQTPATAAPHPTPLATHPLARRGVLVVLGSVVANSLILIVGKHAVAVSPTFKPLQAGPVVFFSAAGALGALGVFVAIQRRARRPIRVYRALALVVLALSCIPTLSLLQAPPSGASAQRAALAASRPEVVLLLLMHLATAALCVTVLTVRQGSPAHQVKNGRTR